MMEYSVLEKYKGMSCDELLGLSEEEQIVYCEESIKRFNSLSFEDQVASYCHYIPLVMRGDVACCIPIGNKEYDFYSSFDDTDASTEEEVKDFFNNLFETALDNGLETAIDILSSMNESISDIQKWKENEVVFNCFNPDVESQFPSELESIETYTNENGNKRYLPKTKEELKALANCDAVGLFQIDISVIHDISNVFEKSDRQDFRGIETWNTSKVTNLSSMFKDCESFNGDVSGWDVSNVADTRAMFLNCTNLDACLSEWDVSQVKDMNDMFLGCKDEYQNVKYITAFKNEDQTQTKTETNSRGR